MSGAYELDVVIAGGTVVTMDDERRVFAGDVLVRDGKIAAVGPQVASHLDARRPRRIVDATGCAVLPGFVQCHVHLCQTLFRGMADDLPLLRWLRERIWPLEGAHDEESLATSAQLGLAELLRTGTTTILDMGTTYRHDVVFEAMRDAGIRGFSGKAMMDAGRGVPKGLRETTRDSLTVSDALAARWDGAEGGRLRYAYAPRFVLSCTEKVLRETAARAAATGRLVHTHAAEHAEERREVRAKFGASDVVVLARFGVEGPRAVLAHAVQVTEAEMRAMGRSGTRVAHCPSSNLKLASGVAKVVRMRRHGVVVGLGADGAPCGNRLDAWTQLREAALLAKVSEGDAAALPAMDALALLTRDGAEVLGLQHHVGSISAGKLADLIVVELEGTHAMPGGDAVSRLVYACGAKDVRDVMVGGRWVVRRGELTTLDEERIRATSRTESKRVAVRAGLASTTWST